MKNEFSDEILINSLVALADPAPFKLYHSKGSKFGITFTCMDSCLKKKRYVSHQYILLKDFVAEFAEIHRNNTSNREGFENNF